MSAHLELDFNDDGTVTLTYRTAKDSDFVTEINSGADSGFIRVMGGNDDAVTNVVIITGRGAATENVLRRYTDWVPVR